MIHKLSKTQQQNLVLIITTSILVIFMTISLLMKATKLPFKQVQHVSIINMSLGLVALLVFAVLTVEPDGRRHGPHTVVGVLAFIVILATCFDAFLPLLGFYGNCTPPWLFPHRDGGAMKTALPMTSIFLPNKFVVPTGTDTFTFKQLSFSEGVHTTQDVVDTVSTLRLQLSMRIRGQAEHQTTYDITLLDAQYNPISIKDETQLKSLQFGAKCLDLRLSLTTPLAGPDIYNKIWVYIHVPQDQTHSPSVHISQMYLSYYS